MEKINLKTGAYWVLLVLVLLISGFDKCIGKPDKKDAKIVIVGAGAAGIAAASKLFEHGFVNVTILEAEDRLGGRIYTTPFGNYTVDLGAQWVHGEVGNVAFELANPLGLLDKSSEDDYGFEQEFTDSLGNPLRENIANSISQFFMIYVVGAAFDADTPYQSIGEYAEKMFLEQFANNPEILKDKKKFLRILESMRISSESADSWRDISASGLAQYKTCQGDQLINWKTQGYSTVLDILMRRYPYPEKELPVRKNTFLNTEVTSIDYSENADVPSPILVTTANGKLFKADHVIVTVSLGVLKDKHEKLFIPPLNEEKISTIEGLGYGDVAKILFKFDEPFWHLGDKRVISFTFLWNEEERQQLEAEPEKQWLLGVFGAMTVEHKPNLLALWVTGKYAKAMEALTEDKVFNHAVENLHRFLGKKYNVTSPVAMLRSTWYTNPHFRGTYSYRSIESEKRMVYARMLEEPIGGEQRKILFAGEATSHNRFSTVDGAIDSGWGAADRLILYYNDDY